MAQIGNKQNSYLNSEWGKHVKKYTKKETSKKRRRNGRNLIKEQLGFKIYRKGR